VPEVSALPLPRESLLVFSDVHLGSDLNDHVKGAKRSERIDRDLVRFLDHYRTQSPPGEATAWRIVIAGDFIDFIGMSIDASGPLTTDLNDEEREHGLGNASEHAREKLRRVAKRHPEVFRALADFVAAGHALTIVHGNHDVEFHWDDVRADFRAHLALVANAEDVNAFTARIDFNPWFFYWGGVAYIEHGHQYDAFCATENLMAPLSPLDPRRVARGFCDVLLRYVVRTTPGVREHGHEDKGAFDYIALGTKLGLRGMLRLGVRFAEAVIELFRLRRAYLSDAASALREEHERRMGLLAEATRIGIDRIRALAALQTPPVTRSIRGILASVLLDRLALGLACSLLLIVSGILGLRSGHFFFASASIALAWVLGHRHLAKRRQLDPAEQMAERASHLARLLPAAFVVMGHTHAPLERPVADGTATYINLGSWAEEEDEIGEPAYRAARTHLVIHVRDGQAVAELCVWDAEGPRKFVAS
jgi:UDP-2,3-diacylglucosamine pyrophosphatase LpxH